MASGPSTAAADLIRRLDDANPFSRRIAAEALGALESFATPWEGELVERSIVDPVPAVRYALLATLERIGWDQDAAVPTFVSLLDHEDQIAQARAAWAVGRVGPAAASATSDLGAVVGDPSRLVDPRWSAAVALARLRVTDPGTTETLLFVLENDDDPDMREACARALGAVDASMEARAALERAVRDPDMLVRESAIEGLATMGEPASPAIPLIRACLDDEWAAVRRAAYDALVRLDAAGPPPELEPARPGADVARRLVELIEGLDSDVERTRGISTFEIGKLGPVAAAAVPGLAELYAVDANLDVRWSAAWGFGKMGGAAEPALPVLLRGLALDPDPDVRAQTAWALGRIVRDLESWKGPAAAALVEALADADSLVREEAAIALGTLGAAGATALEACRRDPHPLVRRAAGEALGRLAS
jgi:HEAT repeat protein